MPQFFRTPSQRVSKAYWKKLVKSSLQFLFPSFYFPEGPSSTVRPQNLVEVDHDLRCLCLCLCCCRCLCSNIDCFANDLEVRYEIGCCLSVSQHSISLHRPRELEALQQCPHSSSKAVTSFIVALVSIGNAPTSSAHIRRPFCGVLLRCSCWAPAEVRKPTLHDEGISHKKEGNWKD